ncbi:unnamed protein product [Meloidogyne enterolobii]|uniref:Uncharacterized protein n=1 Tax=Meloidogyne enterolobii TaxID=390850 RepID=A0ACB1AEQ2_MELEN
MEEKRLLPQIPSARTQPPCVRIHWKASLGLVLLHASMLKKTMKMEEF